MRSIYLFILIVLVSFTFVPVPFSRAEKQFPKGTFSQIIPTKVGSYILSDMKLQAESPGGSAVYRKGAKEIRLFFNLYSSANKLQQQLNFLREKNQNQMPDLVKVEMSAENKYVLYVKERQFSFGWNKGLYYFNVECNEGRDEMDQFMEAFPY